MKFWWSDGNNAWRNVKLLKQFGMVVLLDHTFMNEGVNERDTMTDG